MRKFLIPVAGAACLAVAACTATTSVSNDVAAAEITLTGLENVAVIYNHLPRCAAPGSPPGPVFCSDQATVDKIRSLDNSAYQAVMAARQNSALLSNALLAIGSLQSAIPAISAAATHP